MLIIPASEYGRIPLGNGHNAWVDQEDLWRCLQQSWYLWIPQNGPYTPYAMNRKLGGLHRFILRLSDPAILVDHKDGNGLHNWKLNLRTCNHSQNQMNSQPKSSNYKGVLFVEEKQKWRASIKFNKNRYYLGYFNSEIEAALAYNLEAKILFGEFTNLNPI